MKTTEYYKIERSLLEEAGELKYLAKSFQVTGNHDMHDRLMFTVATLKKAVSKLQEVTTKDLEERLFQVKESGSAILSACLHYATKDTE